MKKTIINEYQLDHLVDIGVLYKTRDDTYHNLIDHKVWGYVCMPPNMVRDVAGKTVEVKPDKDDGEADRWITDDANAWYIQPWMLTEYYDKIKQWGKYIPIPSEKSDGPGGVDIYKLQLISRPQLEELVKNGIVEKYTIVDDRYAYRPVITDMGDITMPDGMAEQICGKTLTCEGTGTTWIEQETEHRWSIAQWMLDRNYEYLLSRKKGCLDPEELEDEDEEEEEEEDTAEPRNFVNIVGEIVEKSDSILTVSVPEVTVLVHLTDCDYGVGQNVSVEGYLVRTANMMGYPEIKCNYIQEV